MLNNMNSNIKTYLLIGVVTLLTSTSVGLSILAYKQHKDLVASNATIGEIRSSNASLLEENSKLKSQVSTLEETNQSQGAYLELSGTIGQFLGQKVDELDALLVRYDDNSTKTVNWLNDNAYFYGDDIKTANYMLAQYRSKVDRIADEYVQIKREIDEVVQALK